MRPFLFRCPLTGLNVQGYHAEPDPTERIYIAQKCPACGGVHAVNPVTGRLMSEERPTLGPESTA